MDSPRKKMNILIHSSKSVLHAGKKGFSWGVKSLRIPFGTIKKAICPKALGNLIAGLYRFLKRTIAGWVSDRRITREGAPDMTHFEEVLESWGIENSDAAIRECIKRLYSRCFCACIMSLLFIASMVWGWEGRFSQILVIAGSSILFAVALVTHIWRISVLKKRRFILFRQWIMGRK